MPHAPQFALSLAMSRQVPPQSVRPAPHETRHDPALHTVPAAQTRPQVPQFKLLLCRSRQVPEQFVSPAPHDV